MITNEITVFSTWLEADHIINNLHVFLLKVTLQKSRLISICKHEGQKNTYTYLPKLGSKVKINNYY